ncbi:hypothetical protein [Sphingomonas melonis]|uniref:Uncharacterized protein n=1 Tax=Sphingomonas melonis TaxID=152682 RepID=A0A7Y9FKL6_9SPHN|nr:hypothetical protein [Sphingomonas melonis]NYD89065.1 hypothetical protein [Sphingomonas melonis]
MTLLRAAIIVALLTPTPSLAQKKQDVSKALENTLPKGWECLQGPNALDRPGRVFYLDRNGIRFELTDVSDKINAQGGELSAVSAGSSGRVSAGLLAKLLGLGGLLSVSASKNYATSVTLTERQEFRTDEAYARAALRTIDPGLIDEANRYFVIRNTQVAKHMQLTVDRSAAAAFGGEVPFTKALTVSGAAPPASSSPSTAMPKAGDAKAGDAASAPAPSSPPPSVKATNGGKIAGGTTSQPSTPSNSLPVTGSAGLTLGGGKPASGTANVSLGNASKPAASGVPASAGASAQPSSASLSTLPPILSAQSARSFTIDQNFTQPLTVCFLAQRFTLKNVAGGVGGAIREAKLEDEFWTPSEGGATIGG